MTDEKITQILSVLEADSNKYPTEAIDDAIARQKEITPHLIQLLEKVRVDPDTYLEIDCYYGHMYALMLLGHFKETEAHQAIIDFVSLPEKVIDAFLGDIMTEDLRMVLFNTCGSSVDLLKQLILNQEANEYCRGAAMDALVYAVVEGLYPRPEASDFLAGLFSGSEAEPDSGFWTFVSSTIQELYLVELMPLVEKAFADNMIDLFFWGGLEDYKSAWADTQAETFEKMRQEMARYSLDDLHKTMAWWAMFEQGEQPKREPVRPNLTNFPPKKDVEHVLAPEYTPPDQPSKPKRQKKKKKRKMAKASRKKNRRR